MAFASSEMFFSQLFLYFPKGRNVSFVYFPLFKSISFSHFSSDPLISLFLIFRPCFLCSPPLHLSMRLFARLFCLAELTNSLREMRRFRCGQRLTNAVCSGLPPSFPMQRWEPWQTGPLFRL